MFLMPSRFEPCGLGQLFALRYGAIPKARKTGGLMDTITDFNGDTCEGNGFLFEDYSPFALRDTVDRAISIYESEKDKWDCLINNALNCNYSWKNSAKKYFSLYNSLIK
ncbi:Glycogen synthase [bioreactor metagenome]|uniref:Glycogen synthase n=1 Tax=bioreactor metagenome TaxID=1076179 RepID=A0A645JI44_9ZZZZ